MSFYTGTQAELLYTLPTAVTKNTYTTQAIFSALAASAPLPTIPAGFFGSVPNGVGRALYLHAEGTIATTSAATFTSALALNTTAGSGSIGASNVTMRGVLAPTAAITAPWHLDAWFTCQAVGTTGGMTIQVNGRWVEESVATGGVPTSTSLASGFSANLTGLLDTTQYFIELYGTWSASAAGNTTTLQQMFLLGLN